MGIQPRSQIGVTPGRAATCRQRPGEDAESEVETNVRTGFETRQERMRADSEREAIDAVAVERRRCESGRCSTLPFYPTSCGHKRVICIFIPSGEPELSTT